MDLPWLRTSLLDSDRSEAAFPCAFVACGNDHGTDGLSERSANDTSRGESNFGEPPFCRNVDRSSPRLCWLASVDPAPIWGWIPAITWLLPRIVFSMQATPYFFLTLYLNQMVLHPVAEYLMLPTDLLSGGDDFVKSVHRKRGPSKR